MATKAQACARWWWRVSTLNRQNAAVCDPGSVILTMLLGVCLGVASAAVYAIGSHLAVALANPWAAAPPLMVELLFSTFTGLLFSLAALVGASLALGIFDHRLQTSRVAQGIIAGIGTVLPGLGLFAYFGQSAAIGFGGIVGVLTFIAGASFTLMYVRSRAHVATDPHRRQRH